jgi:hypothetical protein
MYVCITCTTLVCPCGTGGTTCIQTIQVVELGSYNNMMLQHINLHSNSHQTFLEYDLTSLILPYMILNCEYVDHLI